MTKATEMWIKAGILGAGIALYCCGLAINHAAIKHLLVSVLR